MEDVPGLRRCGAVSLGRPACFHSEGTGRRLRRQSASSGTWGALRFDRVHLDAVVKNEWHLHRALACGGRDDVCDRRLGPPQSLSLGGHRWKDAAKVRAEEHRCSCADIQVRDALWTRRYRSVVYVQPSSAEQLCPRLVCSRHSHCDEDPNPEAKREGKGSHGSNQEAAGRFEEASVPSKLQMLPSHLPYLQKTP